MTHLELIRRHTYTYSRVLSTWLCLDCETDRDFCQQQNPS